MQTEPQKHLQKANRQETPTTHDEPLIQHGSLPEHNMSSPSETHQRVEDERRAFVAEVASDVVPQSSADCPQLRGQSERLIQGNQYHNEQEGFSTLSNSHDMVLGLSINQLSGTRRGERDSCSMDKLPNGMLESSNYLRLKLTGLCIPLIVLRLKVCLTRVEALPPIDHRAACMAGCIFAILSRPTF
jgi:hypothetical protein